VDSGYTIQLALPEHLPYLAEIEREAAQLFVGHDVPESVINDSTPPDEFHQNQQQERLWVALDSTGRPAGFAVVETIEDTCHLEELGVHPRHGRRGIGTALVHAVCDWARQCSYPVVTLTTYRDVPFNAPLYSRLGFRELPAHELRPALAERVREEATRGLDPERRVVMQLET
jgi:GNAT superfamily N-acetyltransferase